MPLGIFPLWLFLFLREGGIRMERLKEVSVKDVHSEECLVEKSFLSCIRAEGILTPVVLERDGSGYTVIDGRRRIAAARALGIEKVPATIIESHEKETDLLGVMLNLHRSPNLAFEVRALRRFIQAGYSQSEIAEMLNVSKTMLKRHFRLLSLCDEGMKRLEEGGLKTSAALALARIPKERQQRLLAEEYGENISLKTVQQVWKDFRLENFSLDLSGIDEDKSVGEKDRVQTLDGLIVEFEGLVGRMSSSRPLPRDVRDAVDTLRRFLTKGEEFSTGQALEPRVALA